MSGSWIWIRIKTCCYLPRLPHALPPCLKYLITHTPTLNAASLAVLISVLSLLPSLLPSVFDYAYTNADTHQTNNKLVFVSW